MADFESQLTRWQSAGILDAETARRIRAHEAQQKKPAGLRWQVIVLLILGAILLACGVALFVSAHWDRISPVARLAVVLAMVSVFHLGGGFARSRFRGLSTALHAVGTLSTGAAIALVGQIFNIQEHWPAAILMWAIAAAAGWVLLRDEAQQTLTLLLFPAWILSELIYADSHIFNDGYAGRFLVVWAVLYLTFFLGSQRKIVQGVLFAIAAIAIYIGVFALLAGWFSWFTNQIPPFGIRVWAWIDFAVLPLLLAVFKLRKSLVPVLAAIVFSTMLPWWMSKTIRGNPFSPFGGGEYSLTAQVLVAAFCVFIIGWGVRHASQALVNLGVVGFAITVFWFYFSNIFDKLDRSLGLIGLGILFLAGGWALEKMRRKLVGGMNKTKIITEEAQ
jgi:uncharacterized membrane protein